MAIESPEIVNTWKSWSQAPGPGGGGPGQQAARLAPGSLVQVRLVQGPGCLVQISFDYNP